MTAHQFLALLTVGCSATSFCHSSWAAGPPPPLINTITMTNGQKRINWSPYPAAQRYKIFRTDDLTEPWLEDTSGSISGFDWAGPLASNVGFHRLEVTPMSGDDLLIANVLNRLAYGPTPDELERVRAMGPDNYILEQIAPESIIENLSIDVVNTNGAWQYVTATGTGSSSILYVYLTTAGEGYIDDIKLVAGTVPEKGANLVRNGDFELPLNTNDWTISNNHLESSLTTDQQHSGGSSLHLVASSGGTTRDSAIWQTLGTTLSPNQTYALSYWFLPGSNTVSSDVTVRLSGSGIVGTPGTLATRLVRGKASIDELRAWHVQHGIQSRRQLLEVLDQFLENHFVTQYPKSRDYFDIYYDGAITGFLATQLEFKENQRWRQALLNPHCTFYDLLRISAESPAMIIYLDTVNSKGNGSNIANENYARELLELFTFGVDNGYDQNDITVMSRAWTGWSVNIVDYTNEFNPFAPRTTKVLPGVTSNLTTVSNLAGIWAFNYKQANHNTALKAIFPGKTVPARFGPPYAGRNYQLSLPSRSGTNGIADGYDVIAHLANQPFTQEYISVKLCRLFIHDDFVHGQYDYRDPNLAAEGQLIRQCMAAWEGGDPKGQIRDVLRVIFNSDLFRNHGGSMQKIKTPLEYLISALRALRAADTDGTFTANLDSAAAAIGTPLNRMGTMLLFDRAEPNGYPEAGPPWISAGTLAERLRFIQALVHPTAFAGVPRPAEAGNSSANPVALLKLKLPSSAWNDPGAVADYFLGILFPGEGGANLDLYRTAAINFLNNGSADSPVNSTPFSGLGNTSANYDSRPRGMVSMLMTSPRFQEQ